MSDNAARTATEDWVDGVFAKKAIPSAAGNFAMLNADGAMQDSGKNAAAFAQASMTYTKGEVDDKIAAATPKDYAQVKAQVQINAGAIADAQGEVADIKAVVSSAATAQNQLVDTQTMNSSIATNTANFLGTYSYVNDLGFPQPSSAADVDNSAIATALGGFTFEQAPTNNDYLFVSINYTPTTDVDEFRRFKFKETTGTWAYEYTLNHSSFTAAQWAAINSGITSGLVAKLGALPTAEALARALAGKQDKLTDAQLANIAAVPDKLDKSGGEVTGDIVLKWLDRSDRTSEIVWPDTPDTSRKLRVFGGWEGPDTGMSLFIQGGKNNDANATIIPRTQGGNLAFAASDPTAGNLAALDANGNPTDSTIPAADVARKGNIPYSLGTPIVIATASSEVVEGETVNYGAATLANRTANVVQVTAATPLDELRITFPAATSGKVRDFGLRVEIGTGSAALAAPALVPIAPTGETIKIENNAAEIPALADGTATAKGVTLLYFSETAPGVFVVKGEQVEEVA